MTPVVRQEDFSAGAFPGLERIPRNGVEDIVNGLLRDDAGIERRGGSSYLTFTSFGAGAPLFWDGYLGPGRVTAIHSGGSVLTASADDTAWLSMTADGADMRPATLAGMLAFTNGAAKVTLYGGMTSTPGGVPAGTVTVTQFSTAVTGVGTNFSSSFTPGTILKIGSTYAVIASIQSNTAMTLASPWPGATTSTAAFSTFATASIDLSAGVLAGITGGTSRVATAGSRLWVGYGNRLAFSAGDQPWNFAATDNHELPGSAWITGLEPWRGGLLVFTTDGVYSVSNTAYDLTDDFGNPQQTLELVDRDLVLWDEKGIAAIEDALLVPAQDDVRVMGAPGVLSEPIRGLYRSYIAAGYTLGLAATHAGHYVLPVVSGSSAIDMLVCRLDRKAWTRWAGHAGTATRLARRVGASVRQPKLIGFTSAGRIANLTDCFAPAAAVKADADGTVHQLQVTSRTLSTAGVLPVRWRKFRVRYELDDAAADDPTLTADYSTGRPGSAFTALAGSGVEGERTRTWTLGKRALLTRLRIRSVGASPKLIVRAIEAHFVGSGRE